MDIDCGCGYSGGNVALVNLAEGNVQYLDVESIKEKSKENKDKEPR